MLGTQIAAAAAYGGYLAHKNQKSRTTDYGNGVTSRRGELMINGKPYANASYDEILRAYNTLANWRDNRGLTTANSRAELEKLGTRKDALYAARQQELYQAAMAEYMGQQVALQKQQESYQEMMAEYQAQMNDYLDNMTKAMTAEEPAAEPLKAAAEVQSAARADTSRKQLLRRGLMSTMTRYGGNGQQQKLGA